MYIFIYLYISSCLGEDKKSSDYVIWNANHGWKLSSKQLIVKTMLFCAQFKKQNNCSIICAVISYSFRVISTFDFSEGVT